MSLLTVLMPNFNNEPFLKEAIKSVIGQSFRDFIFLIIDDGSTDQSISIIESFDDPRIKLIKKDQNTGVVDTLNLGLKTIESKYFIRMDGDDISLPDRFLTLVNFMESNPEFGVCSSHLKLFGNTNEIWRQELNPIKLISKFIYCSGVAHGPSIFRTSVLKKNQILYRNLYPHLEDYDIFNRLRKVTKMTHIDQVLYGYRILNHNITVQNRNTQNLRYKEIYKEILLELNIEPNEKNLKLHLEYFLNEPILSDIRDLLKHKKTILAKNLELKIYPHNELLEILNEKWNYIFFKIAPLPVKFSLLYFYFGKKVKFGQLVYLLKLKVNRILKRKK